MRQTGKCFSCSDVVSPNDYDVDHLSNVKLGDLRVLCRNAIGLRESEAVFDDKHASRADRTDKSLVEVYVRRDEFNETACASSVPLRDLEAHEETCPFRTLMCDLCDVEERGEDGAENPVSSDATRPNHPENGGPCGFVCALRDMPFHRSTCDNRVTNCSFAGFGCEWRGSVRRLDAHRRACRFQPRPCPNGCGAEVSVGSMMMKHLDVCPFGEVACDAPDAEEDPDDPAPARCAAGCASTRPRATSKGRVRVRARVAVSPMSRARLPSKRGDARGDTVRGGARTVSEGLRRVALQVGNRSAPAGTMPASRRRLPVQRPGVRRDGGARIDGFAPPTRRGRAP